MEIVVAEKRRHSTAMVYGFGYEYFMQLPTN